MDQLNVAVAPEELEQERREVLPEHLRTPKTEPKRQEESHASPKRPKSNWREKRLRGKTAWLSWRRSLRLHLLRLDRTHTQTIYTQCGCPLSVTALPLIFDILSRY